MPSIQLPTVNWVLNPHPKQRPKFGSDAQYSDTHLNPKSGSWMPSIQTLTVNPKSKLNWIESGSKKLKLNRIWFLQTSQMSTSRSPTRQNKPKFMVPTRQSNPKFMVPDQQNAYHGPRPAKCLHHGPRPDRAMLNSWSPTRQSNPKFMVPDQPNAYQGPRPDRSDRSSMDQPDRSLLQRRETGVKVNW